MAQPETVTSLPAPLPARIVIDPAEIWFTPRELGELKRLTGLSLTALLGNEEDDERRTQALVWLELRHSTHPEVSWEQAADVGAKFEVKEADPTSGGPLTGSPGSAATGA